VEGLMELPRSRLPARVPVRRMTEAAEPSLGGQTARNDNPLHIVARLSHICHCEERSDEAISVGENSKNEGQKSK